MLRGLLPSRPNGERFTVAGPPPAPADGRGVLGSPNLLWCEDSWDAERERAAEARTRQQGPLASSAVVQRFEREAKKHWDLFYRRNGNRFFKDRHYLEAVFPELATPARRKRPRRRLLEVGCGVGNALFPLLEANPDLDGVAVDFSSVAIDEVRRNPLYTTLRAQEPRRCVAHVCDITRDPLPAEVDADGGLDAVLLLFCLSAVSPALMQTSVRKLAQALRPGGVLLFRDYGRYDEAQLRFGKGHRLAENFYVKTDGTRAYYFTTAEVGSLFAGAGLEKAELAYIRRQYANRAQQVARYRVWVHAKFCKPSGVPPSSSGAS